MYFLMLWLGIRKASSSISGLHHGIAITWAHKSRAIVQKAQSQGLSFDPPSVWAHKIFHLSRGIAFANRVIPLDKKIP